jgi:hypothetical protein
MVAAGVLLADFIGWQNFIIDSGQAFDLDNSIGQKRQDRADTFANDG